MKRYIHSKTSNLPHLSDIITKINFIIICDDISRVPCTISCAEELPDGVDLTDEQSLIQLSDEQLNQLEEADIHNFTNVELLNRLARIDIDKLSAKQVAYLKQENRKQFLITEEDVKQLIAYLKKCNQISYNGAHWKTNKFALNSKGEFRREDCLEVIKNLKVSDYVASSRSNNNEFIGNNVIIFEPVVNWKGNNGIVIRKLILYVKLDIDESSGDTVAIISFHDAAYRDNRPFA